MKSCQSHRGAADAVIVAFGAGDMAHVMKAMIGNRDSGVTLVNGSVTLVNGSVTHFADHQCAAIINAANMEVEFSGGISSIIGNAAGKISQLNAEAASAIKNFWKSNDSWMMLGF